MIRRIQVFPQGPGAGALTAVGVISFGKDDPGPPANLIKVHVHFDSATERVFAPSLGGLRAPRRLLYLAPFAPAPLGPAGPPDLSRRQELGLFGRVKQAGSGLGAFIRGGLREDDQQGPVAHVLLSPGLARERQAPLCLPRSPPSRPSPLLSSRRGRLPAEPAQQGFRHVEDSPALRRSDQ